MNKNRLTQTIYEGKFGRFYSQSMLRFQPYHFETAEPRTVPDEWRDLFARQEGTPPVRVWARTDDDRRVCIYMMDFAPYCYIDAQSTVEQGALFTILEEFNDEFRSVAAKSLFSKAGFKRGPGNGRNDEQQVNYIRELEIVRQQNAIYGYTKRTDQVFLKVTFVQPQLVATFRNWMWKHKTVKSGGYLFGPTVYEANVQYHQRFIVDTKMVPHCWAEVPLDKVVLTDKLYRGRCDLVLAVPYQEVTVCLFDSPKNNALARYRLSFYDDEMISETGAFPVAQNNGDEIVVLAMSSYQLTESGMVPTRRTAFISGGTDVDEFTDGRSVVVTRNERDLLKAAYTHWAVDISDVISGYNIDQFDNTYTFARAARLQLKEFKFFGCASDERVTSKPNTFKSSAYGQTEDLDWDIPGVIDLDLLRYIRREKRNLRSYKLDDVAKVFAKDQKIPMDYRLIKPYYEGTPKQRHDLVDYCFHDEELCARLNDSLQIFVNLVGMARVTGVRICDLICSGQQIKVQSQLLQHVHNRFVVPTFERRNDKTFIAGVNGRDKRQAVQPKRSDFGLPDEEGDNDELHSMDSDELKIRMEAYIVACKACTEQQERNDQEHGDEAKSELNIDAEEEEGKYAGATVFEPKRGFYKVPIMTLDFSSLYPSIMIQHNLSYCTLLRNGAHLDMDPRDYTAAPNGSYFVKPHIREGMLPRILMNLLAERKKTRDEQKKINKDADPFRYAVLEGRQLALKISANSVYGFTGATTGMLPCVEIASAVTAFGREMLDYIKLRIETRYCRANGFEFDADVIYGDTDSCMIKFGPSSMAKCMELGRDAAEWINAHFQALGMDAKLRDDFLAEMKCDTYEEALLRFPKEAIAYAKKHGKSTINLIFEKGLFPMLLINKKRYIGGYYLEPDKLDHIHESGVESVRRDNCLLLAETLKECARCLMQDVDEVGALQAAQQSVADLLQGQVPWEKLVISKGLSKKAEEYANQDVAQQLIVNKLRHQRGMPEYKIGDRVAYVFVEKPNYSIKTKKPNLSFYVEDYEYARDNNLNPRIGYYLEKQLKGPFKRMFDAVFYEGATEKLIFHGEHTRKVIRRPPQKITATLVESETAAAPVVPAQARGIMRFFAAEHVAKLTTPTKASDRYMVPRPIVNNSEKKPAASGNRSIAQQLLFSNIKPIQKNATAAATMMELDE